MNFSWVRCDWCAQGNREIRATFRVAIRGYGGNSVKANWSEVYAFIEKPFVYLKVAKCSIGETDY